MATCIHLLINPLQETIIFIRYSTHFHPDLGIGTGIERTAAKGYTKSTARTCSSERKQKNHRRGSTCYHNTERTGSWVQTSNRREENRQNARLRDDKQAGCWN